MQFSFFAMLHVFCFGNSKQSFNEFASAEAFFRRIVSIDLHENEIDVLLLNSTFNESGFLAEGSPI